MAADLSSFEAFLETASSATASRVGEALGEGRVEHTGEETWEAFGQTFSTPGLDDRFVAAWYGLYLRRCKVKGVEPGEFDPDAL